MSLFPEEQLDSPSGYFPAFPGQTLNGGRWKVLRKLGWGPRSSAWLVDDTRTSDNIEVVKIFTVSSTQDKSANKEFTVFKFLGDNCVDVPSFRESFVEKSEKGQHLCLIFHASSGVSIEHFRQGGALPLHIVKQVVSKISDSLIELHEKNVVHGAVTPDNFLFETVQEADDIRELISSEPAAQVVKVTANDGAIYSTMKSQPLPVDVTPSSCPTKNLDWTRFRPSSLLRFSKAKNHMPNRMSGCLGAQFVFHICRFEFMLMTVILKVYLMLAGVTLFSESSVSHYTEVLSTLEERLRATEKVAESDIPASVEFLKSCLDTSPATRVSSTELLDLSWVREGDVCSCGYCAA